MLFLYRMKKTRKRLRVKINKKPNFISEIRLLEVVPPGIEPAMLFFPKSKKDAIVVLASFFFHVSLCYYCFLTLKCMQIIPL